MIQFHSDKAVAWIRAILWEYNENYTDERVKGLLLRAQQLHPESHQLYLLFFQIALENKGQTDESTAIKCANIVYTNGRNKFTNASFYIEMLNIVDKFSSAGSIQLQIFEDIQTKFQTDEIVWHTLAQRQLHGKPSIELIKLEDEDSKLNENKSFRISKQLPLKTRIELCQKIYEKAVNTVCYLVHLHWSFFLNFYFSSG